MKQALTGHSAHLLVSSEAEKGELDAAYLQELKEENLLYYYQYEAAERWSDSYKITTLHGGWDSITSHIRGTFTGHYLSAAAMLCRDGEYPILRAKAEYIVSEIRKCQLRNGNGWAFPIPEKYLYQLREGLHVWAPIYVCHKLMMGMLDMNRYLGNKTALEVLEGCTGWFTGFMEETGDDTLAMMMDNEETGGIMELWAALYERTGDARCLALMRKMERRVLFDAVLEGRDVLTNIHANAQIPEIHGACKAYEVTGEERYLNIVKNYWRLAVEERGSYATGSQTCGEVWTPPMRLANRLGEKNQEHCVVYNMIRLADYLLRFTGEKKYADYIERSMKNGLLAQHFCAPGEYNGRDELGVVSYYLPLRAGAKKKWGSKTEDFWCCHCTAVQAAAMYRDYVYYETGSGLFVSQYIPSETVYKKDAGSLTLKQESLMGGYAIISYHDGASDTWGRPARTDLKITVKSDIEGETALEFRVPWWCFGKYSVTVDGEKLCENTKMGSKEAEGTAADSAAADNTTVMEVRDGIIVLKKVWTENTILLSFDRPLYTDRMPDEPETMAFMSGPDVLAGLVDEERLLHGDPDAPETMLRPHNERLWGTWTDEFRTIHQDRGFYLKPIREIGDETYTVYFEVKKDE